MKIQSLYINIFCLTLCCLLSTGLNAQQKLDRSIKPSAGELKEIKNVDFKTIETAKGHRIFIVRKDKYPKFRLTLNFNLPDINKDPEYAKREILSDILFNIQSSDKYKRVIEDFKNDGISISFSVNSYTGAGMREEVESVAKTMSQFLNSGFITQADFLRSREAIYNRALEKQRRREASKSNDGASALSEKSKPKASELFKKLKDSLEFVKYSKEYRLNEYDAESVLQISYKDIIAYFNKFYNSDNTFAMLVGDFTDKEGEDLFKKHFGKQKRGVRYVDTTKVNYIYNFPTARKIYALHVPGAAQASISVRWPLVDAFPYADNEALIKVLSQIFGENYSSYINKNLRLDKGLCYGAKCFTSINATGGSSEVVTRVSPENTAYAVENILYEMLRIRNQKVSDIDLQTAKNTLLGEHALSLSAINSPIILGFAMVKEKYNLPDEYLHTYPQKIASITAEQIREAAQRYVKPYECIIYIEGDLDVIKDSLEKFGPVTYFRD